MAEQKTSADVPPSQGVRRSTTHSGVIHVRTYQSGQYVVIGNHLAQHRALSLTAIGLATHILSLPEGALVDIRTLADRFPEGRERIASGLRELEEHGYLERVRERSETGRLVTRTYVHHTPEGAVPHMVRRRTVAAARDRGPVARSSAGAQEPSQEGDQTVRVPDRPPLRSVESKAVDVRPDTPGLPEVAVPSASRGGEGHPRRHPHHDKAVALLAGLRRTDDRLILSSRDVNTLAPSVIRWFERGATTGVVHQVLTSDLPADMRRAAGVLAYRLSELLPPPLPPAPASPPAPVVSAGGSRRPDPFQTCDGCERAFRAAHPGRCRDCRAVPEGAGEVACAA
ncbi:helix-turn-helix domain-containing protein [Streptomyces geysiriensis]|uniref:helix-turn-helix domain-containing protein n=1 Tax=Streptomyces geysiriensis TaxID=68207 RepID=UPI001C7E1598|nr:helix-turn-helix domain-containing protein [Streptomyces geysiriensis]MBX4176798.1 helix-turn-helix domain-containing protein [Streptomyces geysiriensis]